MTHCVREHQTEFTAIALDEQHKRARVPRRVLHFSDGTLEEFSTDDEDESEESTPMVPSTDPRNLDWLPWMWYYLVNFSYSTFYMADKCGEKLSWFFGITSPKYQHAIDEYYRLKRLEEEEDEDDTVHFEKTDITGVSITKPIATIDKSYPPANPPITGVIVNPMSPAVLVQSSQPKLIVPLEKY